MMHKYYEELTVVMWVWAKLCQVLNCHVQTDYDDPFQKQLISSCIYHMWKPCTYHDGKKGS